MDTGILLGQRKQVFGNPSDELMIPFEKRSAELFGWFKFGRTRKLSTWHIGAWPSRFWRCEKRLGWPKPRKSNLRFGIDVALNYISWKAPKKKKVKLRDWCGQNYSLWIAASRIVSIERSSPWEKKLAHQLWYLGKLKNNFWFLVTPVVSKSGRKTSWLFKKTSILSEVGRA